MLRTNGSCWPNALCLAGRINPDKGKVIQNCNGRKLPDDGKEACPMKHGVDFDKDELDSMMTGAAKWEYAKKETIRGQGRETAGRPSKR